MPSRDDYMRMARQIADYMNSFGLAFKTYRLAELDQMIAAIAGEGARVSSDQAARDFSDLLMQRGFLLFPAISDSTDGYVRVVRANSIIANLLSALRYPGPNGDDDLARLLRVLRTRYRPDDMTAEVLSDT